MAIVTRQSRKECYIRKDESTDPRAPNAHLCEACCAGCAGLADNGVCPVHTKITYKGCVIEQFSKVDRVMSDIYADCTYARVWDKEAQEIRSISVKAHFELDNTIYSITPDLTPENAKAVETFKAKIAEEKREMSRKIEIEHLQEQHNRVERGKRMRIVRGRKGKGKEGIVFWMRDGRVGVRHSDAKNAKGHWADVTWVNREEYLVNCEEFKVPPG